MASKKTMGYVSGAAPYRLASDADRLVRAQWRHHWGVLITPVGTMDRVFGPGLYKVNGGWAREFVDASNYERKHFLVTTLVAPKMSAWVSSDPGLERTFIDGHGNSKDADTAVFADWLSEQTGGGELDPIATRPVGGLPKKRVPRATKRVGRSSGSASAATVDIMKQLGARKLTAPRACGMSDMARKTKYKIPPCRRPAAYTVTDGKHRLAVCAHHMQMSVAAHVQRGFAAGFAEPFVREDLSRWDPEDVAARAPRDRMMSWRYARGGVFTAKRSEMERGLGAQETDAAGRSLWLFRPRETPTRALRDVYLLRKLEEDTSKNEWLLYTGASKSAVLVFADWVMERTGAEFRYATF